ncbi:MAG TPA: HlyD family secretion protein [Xanthobacteraceae bacterium]
MADTVLKFTPSAPAAAGTRASRLGVLLRARARTILLVIVPLVALVAGLAFYLAGGRYVSTDNAYVGAQKVLITPDISGKIDHIAVREGQHVAAGEALFEIDPVPYRLALAQAQAKLAAVRTDFTKLKTDLKTLTTLTDLAKKAIEIKQRDVDRKTTLATSRAGSQMDLDTALGALMTAELQGQLAEQQRADTLNALLGDPDLPIEQFPAYGQAKAALDQAERDLDHTTLRAPIAGTATQVDAIQLGRFVAAGTPVFSVIDDAAPWVDANPKETDLTYLKPGQPVTIDVDTFPDHPFHGTVASVSPGTGAQFAILPAQNATGNWVKVVQRVPVRIAFDAGEDTRGLRSGMSVTVDIDTGHRRSLAALVGLRADATPDRP